MGPANMGANVRFSMRKDRLVTVLIYLSQNRLQFQHLRIAMRPAKKMKNPLLRNLFANFITLEHARKELDAHFCMCSTEMDPHKKQMKKQNQTLPLNLPLPLLMFPQDLPWIWNPKCRNL